MLGHKRAVRLLFIVAKRGRDADPFMLDLYAALAEKGTWTDLGRTTAALQAKKASGGEAGRRDKRLCCGLNRTHRPGAVADEFAANLMPLVQAIQNAGAATLSEIARLQRSRCPTSSRQRMAPVPSVRNLIARIE